MKYLLNFDTVAEYDAVKDTLEQPYVVVIDENNGLQYNTDVIRVPEGSCGESGMVYKKGNVTQVMTAAALVRAEKDGDVVIVPPVSLAQFTDYTPVAFGFHPTDTLIKSGATINMGEIMNMTIAQLGLELTDITKEEFYTLS